MAGEQRPWVRQSEAFWRAHHEVWKRSDLNQRQYCEAQGIPRKAFENWRAQFRAEPQPPERKLLYRRRPLSPLLSPPVSPPISPVTYPSSLLAGSIVPRPREGHRRRFTDVFWGRTRANLIKIVFWDGTGLCLFTKRLEHGVFLWPASVELGETLSLTSAQLSSLIDGVDWRAPEQRWRPAIAG